MNLAKALRPLTVSLIPILIAGCQTTPNSNLTVSTANPNFGKFAQAPTTATKAILVSQWHLSPQMNTKLNPTKNPQDENQLAIYSQVSEWIDHQILSTVVVEGCEGEIEPGFTANYNGWTLADLEQLPVATLTTFDTQIGIRLKARYKESVKIICGDDLKLIKQNQLTLSDLRGLLGFKIRIENAGGDTKKRAGYLTAARDVLKILADVSDEQILVKIDQEIKVKLDDFESVIRLRNQSFANIVAKVRSRAPVAVVIGAIHIEDLKKQIQNSVVFVPKGLRGDESEIIQQARDLLSRRKNL